MRLGPLRWGIGAGRRRRDTALGSGLAGIAAVTAATLALVAAAALIALGVSWLY